MARKHETSSRPNADGSTHHSKHSYEGTTDPGHHRSHDRNPDGSKSNDHQTDHASGRIYWVTDSSSGRHQAGDVTNHGHLERRDDGWGFFRWLNGDGQ